MQAGESQGGVALVAVLFALALVALGAHAVMSVASRQTQRDREAQLQRVGTAFARAIQSYREASPGSMKSGPHTLDDLVVDRRFLGIRRHIRKIYPDPITQSLDWGLVRSADGAIEGVFSQSGETSIQVGEGGSRYSDWKFVGGRPDGGS